MAQLGGLAGIAGLTSQVDGGQSAQRELATMQALEQSIKMDEAESLKLQEIEAAEYEKIAEMSSSLLERDRNKINDKALGLQNEIRNKIREYGSKKDFYANGGFALLKSYKTQLLNSEEVSAYKENKVNLDTIYKIQLAGKGHLLPPRDIKALQDYQNGTGDRVTYSGMMNELDYPTDLYNYGEDISLENILRNKDNYAKVAANFFIENPNMKGLPRTELDIQLLGFMKKMGYGAKGTDKDKMKLEADMAKKMLDIEMEKIKQAGTEFEDKTPKSFLSEYRAFKSEIRNKEDGTPLMATDVIGKNYMSALKQSGDTRPNFIFGNNLTNNTSAYKENSNTLGNLYNADYFKLASSNNLLGYSVQGISDLIGVKGEDGSYEFEMKTSDTFKATGAKITNKDLENDYLDGGDDWFGFGESRTSAKGKIVGVHSAFKSSNGDLITEVVNNKNEMKTGRSARDHSLAYKDQSAELTMVVAIKDEGGSIIYKEINVNQISDVAVLQKALGVADDITIPLKQSQSIQKQLNKKQKYIDDNPDNIRQAITSSSSNGLFTTDEFINEAKMLQASSGTVDRTPLLKSFYAVRSAVKNNRIIDKSKLNSQSAGKLQLIISNNPELANAIVNPNITNEKFMDMFLESINKLPNGQPESADVIRSNTSVIEAWKSVNKIINNKKQ